MIRASNRASENHVTPMWYFLEQCEVPHRLSVPGLGEPVLGILGMSVLVLGVPGF